jgi:putative ABC transport system ATP-binding protein
MIHISNLFKTYPLGALGVSALKNINLTIDTSRFIVIAGASGSGKSTLLNIIGSIERPTAGTVEINDKKTNRLTSDEIADLRARHMGFVFQTFNLFPTLTAYENVEFPMHLIHRSEAERHTRVLSLLQQVGLERFAQHKPSQLSGGQRQRVAIARALANSPSVILADEPTANVDRATGVEIIQLLKDLNQKMGVTILLATHDPAIMQMADRVVELLDGEIVKDSQ